MKIMAFASLLVASSVALAQQSRDGYYSWSEYEKSHQRYIADSSKPGAQATSDLTGLEQNSVKFDDELRKKMVERNIPPMNGHFIPWGWTEKAYREARANVYIDTRAAWQKDFRADYEATDRRRAQERAYQSFDQSKPAGQTERDAYTRTSPAPRPSGLLVLGYGADPASPHESALRSIFSMQERMVKQSDPRKNLILTQGSVADVRAALEAIAQHDPKKKLVVTLAIGLEPPAGKDGSAVRGATAIAKFFASNPELIEAMKAKGVIFSVLDGGTWATLESYLASDEWKKRNREMNAAQKEVADVKFQAKVQAIERLEKSLPKAKDQATYDKTIAQIEMLRAQTSKTFARAYASELVSGLILELPLAVKKSAVSEVLVTRVNENIAAEVGVKDTRSSGSKFDPTKAAKAARVAK